LILYISVAASQGYFAPGITDELITDRRRISALRVIPRPADAVVLGHGQPLQDWLAFGDLGSYSVLVVSYQSSLVPLFCRIVLGAFSGASLCVATGYSSVAGAVLGGAGGVTGAFVGYRARAALVKTSRWPDWVIALLEDLVAVGGGFLLVARF
jgi:hypothetical protein